MSSIKILDCTLRDGGYINNWHFGKENIKSIINNLVLSGCEYIECGIIKDCEYNIDKTLFSDFRQLEKFIPKNSKSQFVLLVNYGDVNVEKIDFENKNIIIKVTFKKFQVKEALEYSKILIEKGYKVFINPMNTISYSSDELIDLITVVNKIKPIALSIVDTNGEMTLKDTSRLYSLINKKLNKKIIICFHSHNNLQLSFANAQILMGQNTNRTIIIDSTVLGMGRGAGNLCTELLVKYINDNYNGNYELIPILKIIDEQIKKIFSVSPWGYSAPYCISALMHCHPNYAKYLIDKKGVTIEQIAEILNRIPYEERAIYDINSIEKYAIKFNL
ncbi:TPA: aldolase catalytic domain-containing protein [Candidatus Avigastranaerophilus faecigallinarum]|nr:aldolase catalytic domain-containing protein [Candidatus Avigastranaerophilus faecigallinarum]